MLTLAIPVSIFLFLKIFGTNTYDVPYLFEDGIPGCPNKGQVHLVPDIMFETYSGQNTTFYDLNGYVVFAVIDMSDSKTAETQLVELVRIQDAFFEIGSPTFVLLTSDNSSEQSNLNSLSTKLGLNQKNIIIAHVQGTSDDEFLTCGIALENAEDHGLHNLVLVDPQHRIRGVYNSLDIEKTDQLILELKILQSKN